MQGCPVACWKGRGAGPFLEVEELLVLLVLDAYVISETYSGWR
ncbi:hypothetical protein [Streptomyces sp. NPDC058254]